MNLGSTWNEAIESVYTAGFEQFEYSMAGIIDEVREVKDSDGEDAASELLLNEYDWFISESTQELWWAIEDFYKDHMSEEEYEHLMREAVVAEDLSVAFQAGAYDAIMEKECDTSRVGMLLEDEH